MKSSNDKVLSIQIWLDKISKNLLNIERQINNNVFGTDEISRQYYLISLIKKILENKIMLIGDNPIRTYVN